MDIRPEQTVADIVVRHPEWRERLEKMGIDYCCGGKRPLGQAVTAAGLEWQAFAATLNDTSAANAAAAVHTNWNEAPLGILVDHILEKHHAFTKGQLSRLDGLLTKVATVHGARHGEMLARLRRLYDGLRDELDAHLMKEEQILFPAIKEIDAFISGRGRKPVIHCGSVANPIRQMEVEHDSAVLVDARKAQAEGQASDLAHGLPFVPSAVVRAGSADDYADAAAIVITAGAKQKPGESRLDLLRRNILIMDSIVDEIAASKSEAVSVLTVSTLLDEEYGLKDVCLSVPCIVSQAGIERIIVGKLTDEEQRDLTASAMVLKKTLTDLAGADG